MKRLLAVSASAGSGKTFRLANRYIALLNLDNPVNIVAITFTNKAANEMKERIIKFLIELGNDKNVVNMVCDELEISEKELLNKKDKLLKKILTSDVSIQTIDSFINKILRKFSYFAGVRNNFKIIDINNEVIFKNFIDSLSDEEFKKLINFAKKEERFLEIAAFFENLYEKDKELKNIILHPKQIPDEKTAKEAFNKLKEYILNHSKSSSSAIKAINIDFYDIPNSTWFKKESLKEYSYFKKKDLYQDWFEEVLRELKNFFKEYFEYIEYQFFNELFYFYEKYKEIRWEFLKGENKLSFKDVEHLVYKLLREDELKKDFLYFRLDSKVNHMLFDEFQDTSITQWEIFEPLVEEIASGIGRKEERSFFYVGDVKQAIYRFRGGSKELFYKVAEKFNSDIELLDTNYRSAKNIVEFVNEKFNLNEKVKRKEEGYVEVDEITKDEAFNKILEKIEYLNKNGVEDKDIAILVYKNDDILKLGEFLQNAGKKVITAKKALVISQQSAKAIISLMKYLYDNSKKIELLNFLSLIGKKWGEEVDIMIQRPVLMIKEIMDKYNIMDEAALKLLYHSKKYDTLFDFVREIDSYNEELPLSEFDGITIMTIHKSKGLEFDNVIVIDKLSDKDVSNSNILFYYEDAKLKELKLKIKGRELIDNEYKYILQKEEKLSYEDKKNLEYVAFTRAKNGLIILKRSEVRKNGTSLSAFVTHLEKIKKGKIIPSKITLKSQIKRKKITLKNYGKQELNIPKEEEYKPNDFEAIIFGEALHYAFECESIEAVRNRYGDYCDIEEVAKIYKTSKPLLPAGKKEIPYIVDGNLGKIDLLCEDVIIDYKSKKPADESEYIKQVKKYIKAVEKITGKKLKGKIFYADILEFKDV